MHILRKRKYFKKQPNFTPQKLKKKKAKQSRNNRNKEREKRNTIEKINETKIFLKDKNCQILSYSNKKKREDWNKTINKRRDIATAVRDCYEQIMPTNLIKNEFLKHKTF